MTALDELWRQGALRRLMRHLETTPARPVVVPYRFGQHCPSCGGTAWSGMCTSRVLRNWRCLHRGLTSHSAETNDDHAR